MPSELTTAATWDRALTYNRTLRMGHEWRELGVNIALAPVTGGPIGRSPLGGRFWEGAPADPYLCGEIAYASVMGLQVREAYFCMLIDTDSICQQGFRCCRYR